MPAEAHGQELALGWRGTLGDIYSHLGDTGKIFKLIILPSSSSSLLWCSQAEVSTSLWPLWPLENLHSKQEVPLEIREGGGC